MFRGSFSHAADSLQKSLGAYDHASREKTPNERNPCPYAPEETTSSLRNNHVPCQTSLGTSFPGPYMVQLSPLGERRPVKANMASREIVKSWFGSQLCHS